MTQFFLLYTTFPNHDEAILAGRALLEQRLVACVNITDSLTSLYRWEGKIQQEKEVLLTAKTTLECLDRATDLIKEHHSYELPCIVSIKLESGFAPFLDWIKAETLAG